MINEPLETAAVGWQQRMSEMSLLFDIQLSGKDQASVEFSDIEEVIETLGPGYSFIPGGALSSEDGSIVVRAKNDFAVKAAQSLWAEKTGANKDPQHSFALDMVNVTPYYRDHTDSMDRMVSGKSPEPTDTRSGRVYLIHTKNQDLFNGIAKDLRPFDRKSFEPLGHPRFGTILDPSRNLMVIIDHDRATNSYPDAAAKMQDFASLEPALTLTLEDGMGGKLTMSGSSQWVMSKYREFEDELQIQRVEGKPDVELDVGSVPVLREMPASFFNGLVPRNGVNPRTGTAITLYTVTEKALESLNFRDGKGQPVARLNEQSPSVALKAGDVIDLSGQMSQTLVVKESDLIPAKRRQSRDLSM